jgi:hypothetical protein
MNQIQSVNPYYTIPGIFPSSSGNSITIIEGAPGPKGDAGEQGPKGDTGEQGPKGTCEYPNTTVVKDDYIASIADYYIGVVSEDPITISLPENPPNGKILVIKWELGTPAGQRIATINTLDGSLIDGASSQKIKAPYRMLQVIYRAGAWYIIGKI